MISLALHDMRLHWHRTVGTVLAISVTLALSLLLAGVSSGWHNETKRTLSTIGGTDMVVPHGSFGPFTGTATMKASLANTIAHEPGVTAAAPMVAIHNTLQTPKPIDANVIGYELGSVTRPHPVSGRLPQRPGEALADVSLHVKVGSHVTLIGRPLLVVGLVKGIRYFAGQPVLLVPIQDAQRAVYGGRDLAAAIVTQGTPRRLPPGLAVLSRGQLQTDISRPVGAAVSTVAMIAVLLIAVAIGVTAMVTYLSSLERTREMAVLKAIGGTARSLFLGLGAQSVLLVLGAAAVGTCLALVLRPLFPMAVEIPYIDYGLQPLAAAAMGVLASLVALRRVLRIDPALAFSMS